MGYVIAAILVLLLVAGFITFMVINATRRREDTPAGIVAPDETPLGDSAEHSGAGPEGLHGLDPQSESGREPEREDTRPESERLANRPR